MDKQIIQDADELRAWIKANEQGYNLMLNNEFCYYGTVDRILANITFPCLLITHEESRRANTDDIYATTITKNDCP